MSDQQIGLKMVERADLEFFHGAVRGSGHDLLGYPPEGGQPRAHPDAMISFFRHRNMTP